MVQSPRWAQAVFWGAGCYNIVWGVAVSLFPSALLHWFNTPNVTGLAVLFFQSVGMMIMVVGLANLCAAHNPLRYWPLIVAGFLGRVLGPPGFLLAAKQGLLAWDFGWTIVTNDLLWLPFFSALLWLVVKKRPWMEPST